MARAPVDRKTRLAPPSLPRPADADYRPVEWRTFFRQNWDAPRWDPWYGLCPVWRISVEADARRAFGRRLEVVEGPYALEYRVALDVIGPNSLVDATIVFYARPPYRTFGLPAQDYPRVWAQPGLPSKHRMPEDDALCMYYPNDPPQHRWTADKGLLDLLDLVVDHLGFETYWRATGGHDGGIWPGAEAQHGFPDAA